MDLPIVLSHKTAWLYHNVRAVRAALASKQSIR